jgi:hypothetical protein
VPGGRPPPKQDDDTDDEESDDEEKGKGGKGDRLWEREGSLDDTEEI